MNILMIGSGSVAHYICQWLSFSGHKVLMYQPSFNKKHVLLPITSCWLNADGMILDDPFSHPLITGSEDFIDCSGFDSILCAATVERAQELVCSQDWKSFAREDMILLTSWHGTYAQLCERLPINILPAYPDITCEHWEQHLVGFGSLLLETDRGTSSNTKWEKMIGKLNCLGFQLSQQNMATRFRARFSMTSFAYAYIRSLPGHTSGLSRLDFNLESGINQLEGLLEQHPDLVGCIQEFPSCLDQLWMDRAKQGAVGWAIDVLMNRKPAKTDYFIDRLPIGI